MGAKYPERVLVLFPEGTKDAIRSRVGDRGSQEFIRRAVAAALDGGKAVPDVPRKPETRAVGVLDGTAEAVLGALPGTVRQIAKETGLFEGRVEKEVRALERAGLVRWASDGMVERSNEGETDED